jgi:hypothetical protein
MKQRNAQNFVERNTEEYSVALENQQAREPVLLANGKGKATVHAVPSKWSREKHLTLSHLSGADI